jgi:deoxyadenosine/deoxycytidine kinase
MSSEEENDSIFTSASGLSNRSLIGSIICIEGLVGAGKSTLGKKLCQYLKSQNLNVKFYPEFVNKDLLKLYINDMKKYAFSFQVIMLRERLRVYKEAYEFANTGGISIIDRSLVGDYTFARMQYEKKFFSLNEWEVYLSMLKQESSYQPSIILYLNCESTVAFERMKKRGIQSEIDGYTLDYFNDLNSSYENTLAENNARVHKLDWNKSSNVDKEVLNSVIDEIKMFIHGI